MEMTRRELIAAFSATGLSSSAPSSPAPPVSLTKCQSYDDNLTQVLNTKFDQSGGLGRVAKNKTVTLKLNLTGTTFLKFPGQSLSVTHYSHPKMEANRVRFVESAWATCGIKPASIYGGDAWKNKPNDIALIDGMETVARVEGQPCTQMVPSP